MEFTIISGKGEQTVVNAEESVTPGLLLTQAIGWQEHYKAPKWHVTHKGTTAKLTGDMLPKKHARLIAGALAGLPVDWNLAGQEEIYKAVRDNVLEPYRTWLTRTLRY